MPRKTGRVKGQVKRSGWRHPPNLNRNRRRWRKLVHGGARAVARRRAHRLGIDTASIVFDLDDDRVAGLESAHVKLADGRSALRSVSDTVDHETARTADSFAAVVIERDRIFALCDQVFVQDIEHLEERHVRIHFRVLIADHPALLVRTLLPPDVKNEPHYL